MEIQPDHVRPSILTLDYRGIAVRYDLGSLKEGGDFSIGNLATTVDGDLKLGNDQHNALHRLVVRWQMEASALAVMFDSVIGSRHERDKYAAMIDLLVARHALDEETIEQFHELQLAIGVNSAGPGNAAGAIAVALTNLLRREWRDLGKPNTWDSAGSQIAGRSFGSIIEAAANNFRHCDEWARTDPPTPQQLDSIRIIADVFRTPLPPNGSRHPFRGNVCPKLLLVVSSGDFETLADEFFAFARALANV